VVHALKETSASQRMRSHLRPITGALILVAMTLAVYLPVRDFDFVNFDDMHYVYENERVKAGLSAQGVLWAFSSVVSANWHPLTLLSLMTDVSLFDAKPGVFHLVNVFYHIVNTVLLFLLVYGFIRGFWPAFFMAALFSLHPLHVESVAWISERKDVLSTMFWFLTIAAYGYYLRKTCVRRYLLIIVFFSLGLLSKPMLVMLPLTLLILDFWPIKRFSLNTPEDFLSRPLRAALADKIPLCALSIASAVATLIAQHGAVASLHHVSIYMRLSNAIVSYVKYLLNTIAPVNLACYYPLPGHFPTYWQVAGAVVALLGVTAVVVLLRKSRPFFLAGWLWYILTLFPVIGIVQVGSQALADRYTYVPLLGIFAIAVWGFWDLIKWKKKGAPAIILTGIVVVLVLGAVARVQVTYWRNSIILFKRALSVTSSNSLAHEALAGAYSAAGNNVEAVHHFRAAVAEEPANATLHYDLASSLEKCGKVDDAVVEYEKALSVRPDSATLMKANCNLASIIAQRGRPAEALVYYNRALALSPNDEYTLLNKGSALILLQRFDEAEPLFQRVIKINPKNIDAYVNIGTVLYSQGKYQESAAAYAKALRLEPTSGIIHRYRGYALREMGHIENARQEFEIADRLQPGYPQAREDLESLR
jgi:protein O-mannosyl-transferase